VLRQIRELPLEPGQRIQIDMLARELDDQATATCREILAMAAAGKVLAANALAIAALDEDPTDFGRELSGAFAAAGIGSPPKALPNQVRARWPMPAPLGRERMVRAMLPDGEVLGVVVDSRSDRVTLRVESERGLYFPTVGLWAVEPNDVQGGEAAELGFAALHAGDPLLARLWLNCALARALAEPSARTERLASLLR
jgi:hypothetical protein